MEGCEDESDYKSGGYHPVKIGDLYYNRYKVLQKIGYGHFSTVWLCEDEHSGKKVALKIQKSASNYTDAAMDEIDIISKIHRNYTNPKWRHGENVHIVKILNHFMHKGPFGCHVCIVFEMLGANLAHLMNYYQYKGVPLHLCKIIIKQCLMSLDYLHRICGVIHTDIKPENILISLNNEQILELQNSNNITQWIPIVTENELVKPVLVVDEKHAKNTQKRKKKNFLKAKKKFSRQVRRGLLQVKTNIRLDEDIQIKIADFGNACWVHKHFSTEIQTLHYRSPEVILGKQYNQTADVWSLGCVLYELLVGECLFNPSLDNYEGEQELLLQISEVFGDLCFEWGMNSKYYKKFLDQSGKLKRPACKTRDLEMTLLEKGFSSQDARETKDFLMDMIMPNPENRPSASRCLDSKWMNEE